MKIRNGFVSNSSSSSFVIVGCALTSALKTKLAEKLEVNVEDDDWMYDGTLESKYGFRVLSTEDSKDGGDVMGKVLADVSSDGDWLERSIVTFNELREIKNQIHDILGDGLDVTVALHIGTRPS